PSLPPSLPPSPPPQVLFRPLPESDESRDELMETVTTDESVVKEYNPYREAELMERREPVISYMGRNMNRCMREILQFRIAQKKILYQVISDICHTMYGHGLVQSVNDMEELEEERQLMQSPEESSRPLTSASGRGGGRSLESILSWATKTFGDDAGL
ncbi:histone-lysine n-methyltransferase setd3-like, partial [Nannochloropsis oceanica]